MTATSSPPYSTAKIMLRIARRRACDPETMAEARRISPNGEFDPIFQNAKTYLQQTPTPTLTVDQIEQLDGTDDVAVHIASILMALGHQIRFVAVCGRGKGSFAHYFAHIYVETKISEEPERWIAMDPYCAGDMGSVYPGLTEIVT